MESEIAHYSSIKESTHALELNLFIKSLYKIIPYANQNNYHSFAQIRKEADS